MPTQNPNIGGYKTVNAIKPKIKNNIILLLIKNPLNYWIQQ